MTVTEEGFMGNRSGSLLGNLVFFGGAILVLSMHLIYLS